MALQHSIEPKAGIMAEHRIDRSYTVGRVEWMLENYHALLTKRALPPQEKEIMSGVVTIHSQWWSAQAYWRKVDKRSDLVKAVEWATGNDYRKRAIIQYRYYNEPADCMSWDEIAAMLALSRMHVWRLHRRIVTDVCWYLGGTSDE